MFNDATVYHVLEMISSPFCSCIVVYLEDAMGARWPVRSSASSLVPTSRHLEDAFTFLQEENATVNK
jgi:hypothetical protein